MPARPKPRPSAAPARDPLSGRVGLGLSGGGYRAMLFHLGALWRLNEWGLLPRLSTVSSVSGGSIAAGVLALAWKDLGFDRQGRAARFGELVVKPLRDFAGRDVDVRAIVAGLVRPGGVAGRVEAAYRRHLFGDRTLQDLPDAPNFVFNATNLHTGGRWTFSKPLMGDYNLDRYVVRPDVPVARAVAASSAFPPVLSPLRLRVDPPMRIKATGERLPTVLLTDGGAYDNLGLQPLLKDDRELHGVDEDRHDVVLASDGGKKIKPKRRQSANWVAQYHRVQQVMFAQVRSRRTHALVEALQRREAPGDPDLRGGLWAITTRVRPGKLPGALDCPDEDCRRLAALGTRLASLDEATQARLVNWGYAVSDYVMRSYADPGLPPPAGFPYPGGVAWA